MAGQLIVLPGVTAAASASAPRIDMNTPDTVAAKIVALKHIVSARSLVPLVGGGVSGRCRNTGAVLSVKGSQPVNMNLGLVAGKTGLGGAGYSALALPPGSLTSSYTMVFAVALSAADIAGNAIVNPLSGFAGNDAYSSVLARYYGKGDVTRANLMRSAPFAGGAVAGLAMPAGAWAIVVVDYDNNTRTASISVNQANSFSTSVMAASFAPDPSSYLTIGYPLDANGLRTSKVGDLYTFSDSVLRTEFGRLQIAELVAALKTEYSIA